MISRMLLLLLLSPLTIAFAQNNNPEAFRQFLQHYRETIRVPSVSAGIAHNGEIVWMGSEGYADLGYNIEANPQTLYRIASISKFITSVAVMQLVEKGLIDIDKDIWTYLPDFPAKRYSFTVRQVMNHTSGLRSYKGAHEFNSTREFESIDAVMNYYQNDPLVYEPGTQYLYSTLSYTLLSSVIEKVSGKTFEEYLHEEVFAPADMERTFLEDRATIYENFARGYDRKACGGFENTDLADLSIKYPGGGLISCVEDLLKLGIALNNETLISSDTFDKMTGITILANGDTVAYGLGSHKYLITHGEDLNGHGGGGTGFISLFALSREKDFVFAHLINLRSGNCDLPSWYLKDMYFGNEEKELKRALVDTLRITACKEGPEAAITFFRQEQENGFDTFAGDTAHLIDAASWMTGAEKYETAEALLDEAKQIAPENPAVYQGYSRLYFARGMEDEALKQLEKAVELAPENEYFRQALDNLQYEVDKIPY